MNISKKFWIWINFQAITKTIWSLSKFPVILVLALYVSALNKKALRYKSKTHTRIAKLGECGSTSLQSQHLQGRKVRSSRSFSLSREVRVSLGYMRPYFLKKKKSGVEMFVRVCQLLVVRWIHSEVLIFGLMTLVNKDILYIWNSINLSLVTWSRDVCLREEHGTLNSCSNVRAPCWTPHIVDLSVVVVHMCSESSPED